MGFKSLFPNFNRDEVTPNERDESPDVESRIGRTLARLQGFSNILNVFKFLRSDYNGRLHINSGPTDFDNHVFGNVGLVAGINNILAANPDRQVLFLTQVGGVGSRIAFVEGLTYVWQFDLAPGQTVVFYGITQQVTATSTVASGTIDYAEI